MKNLRFYFTWLISLFILSCSAQNIELTIKGIRSTNGYLLIGIFKNNESFQKEKPYKSLKFSKINISKNTLTVTFELEPGVFGLSLLDDENNNGKMDYSFLGIPKEGFGFSNYYHKGLTKPNFYSFMFKTAKGAIQKVEIEIRYML